MFSFDIARYLNPIIFPVPLIFARHEGAKINTTRNRPFFAHLNARKLVVHEFLKYYFRSESDGILQYFSPQ